MDETKVRGITFGGTNIPYYENIASQFAVFAQLITKLTARVDVLENTIKVASRRIAALEEELHLHLLLQRK